MGLWKRTYATSFDKTTLVRSDLRQRRESDLSVAVSEAEDDEDQGRAVFFVRDHLGPRAAPAERCKEGVSDARSDPSPRSP